MARELHDFYFRKAKEEGYLSRAVYKLVEIDDRKKILRRGDLVLDCGCAPGSWVQMAAKRVGPKGAVVGIDLKPPAQTFGEPNVRILQGDFTSTDTAEMLGRFGVSSGSHPGGRRFDVVLSDMAPDTTGDPFSDHHRSARLCETLLDRCPALLRPGGNLVMKVFEGEAYPALLKRSITLFERAKGFKPKASRDESVEMYLIGLGYKAPVEASETDADLPRRRPSAGWSNA